MKTVVIQIGNSDDRLTQREWYNYVHEISEIMTWYERHFVGFSAPDSPYQNAAWVINVRDDEIDDIVSILESIRVKYNQDSVAVTIGDTRFV